VGEGERAAHLVHRRSFPYSVSEGDARELGEGGVALGKRRRVTLDRRACISAVTSDFRDCFAGCVKCCKTHAAAETAGHRA